MNIRRPVSVIGLALFITAIAKRRDIIGKSVKPDINCVTLAYRHGNAPIYFGSGYT